MIQLMLDTGTTVVVVVVVAAAAVAVAAAAAGECVSISINTVHFKHHLPSSPLDCSKLQIKLCPRGAQTVSEGSTNCI